MLISFIFQHFLCCSTAIVHCWRLLWHYAWVFSSFSAAFSLSSLWQRGTFLSQAIRSWNTHCVRRTKIPRIYKHFQDSSFARCSSLAFRTYNFHLLLCHTFYPVSYNFITHKDRRARECSFTQQPSKLKATQFNWFSMNIGVDGKGGIEFKFAKIKKIHTRVLLEFSQPQIALHTFFIGSRAFSVCTLNDTLLQGKHSVQRPTKIQIIIGWTMKTRL